MLKKIIALISLMMISHLAQAITMEKYIKDMDTMYENYDSLFNGYKKFLSQTTDKKDRRKIEDMIKDANEKVKAYALAQYGIGTAYALGEFGLSDEETRSNLERYFAYETSEISGLYTIKQDLKKSYYHLKKSCKYYEYACGTIDVLFKKPCKKGYKELCEVMRE